MTGNRYNYKKAKELMSDILDKPKMLMKDIRIDGTSVGNVSAVALDRGQLVMSAIVFNGYSNGDHKLEPNGICIVKETDPDNTPDENDLEQVINDCLGDFNKLTHGEFLKLDITLV